MTTETVENSTATSKPEAVGVPPPASGSAPWVCISGTVFPHKPWEGSRRPYGSPAVSGWAVRDVRYDHYNRGDGWWTKDTAMIWPDRSALDAYLATWRGSGASREVVWLDQPEVPAITGWAVKDKWGQYDTGPRWGLWSSAGRAMIYPTREQAEAACFKGDGYQVVELSWPPALQNVKVRDAASDPRPPDTSRE